MQEPGSAREYHRAALAFRNVFVTVRLRTGHVLRDGVSRRRVVYAFRGLQAQRAKRPIEVHIWEGRNDVVPVALRPLADILSHPQGAVMPMMLIKGFYDVTGSQPDGDTVHFTTDNPSEWNLIGGGRARRTRRATELAGLHRCAMPPERDRAVAGQPVARRCVSTAAATHPDGHVGNQAGTALGHSGDATERYGLPALRRFWKGMPWPRS